MNFSILCQDLLTPLIKVINLVPRTPKSLVWSYVRVNLEIDSRPTIHITASNSYEEVHIFSGFSSYDDLPTSLSFLIPAKKLYEICKTFPSSCILDFTLGEKQLRLKAGTASFRFNLLGTELFSSLSQYDEDLQCFLELETSVFLELLNQVEFASATEDVRHYLNGLHFDLSSEYFRVVGSNGHRLALSEVKTKEAHAPNSCILTKKTVQEIIRLFDNEDGIIYIGFNKRLLIMKSKNEKFEKKLFARLIQGTYPNYLAVFPQNLGPRVDIFIKIFKEALQRVSIFENDRLKGVCLEFSSQLVSLKTSNGAQDEAEEEIKCEYEGPKFKVDFNIAYLLDALKVLSTDIISLQFNHNLSAVSFNSDNSTNGKRTHARFVIMTMRL